MFSRIEVNGPGTHPLYRYLKARRKGLLGTSAMKWNFTKFLVDRDGAVVARFGSTDTPDAIEPAIVRPPARSSRPRAVGKSSRLA